MIKRLNELSLAHFIDLLCGEYHVLKPNGASDKEVKSHASKLINEYQMIVDPYSGSVFLFDWEETLKDAASILLYKTCKELILLDCHEEVRCILSSLSYATNAITDEQLATKVDELLHSASFELKRKREIRPFDRRREEGKPSCGEIRASFDVEIAFMMTYFKMNIDMYTINASVYANIVRQAHKETNARSLKN